MAEAKGVGCLDQGGSSLGNAACGGEISIAHAYGCFALFIKSIPVLCRPALGFGRAGAPGSSCREAAAVPRGSGSPQLPRQEVGTFPTLPGYPFLSWAGPDISAAAG